MNPLTGTVRPSTPRRLALSATVLSTALLLAACGGSDDGGDSAAGDSGSDTAANVAAVIKGLDNPFFQAMEAGIKSQGTDPTKVSVQAAASITDTTGQGEKLTAMAGQDFNCFVVNPISGNNLVQGLAQIARKKTPIVNIDSPVDAEAADAAGAEISTYIGTDNVAAGRKAGDEMVTVVGGSGEVALIGGIAGDVTSGARLDGFTEGVDGKLTVVQTVAADWERQKALTAATDLMRAHPDLKGFFAANDDMGLGISRAIANAGQDRPDRRHLGGRQQGRPRGGQGRRAHRDRRAVPVRHRVPRGPGLRGSGRRQDAPAEDRGTDGTRHQGRRRSGHREVPGAVRHLRQPPRQAVAVVGDRADKELYPMTLTVEQRPKTTERLASAPWPSWPPRSPWSFWSSCSGRWTRPS